MKLNNLIALVACLFLISGCSILDKKRTTIVKQEPFMLVHPSSPDEVTMREVKWKVLTPEIAERMLETDKDKFVFIALTPDHYENLSLNMQEIIRYMKEQKQIIFYYRENVPNAADEADKEDKKDRK